MNYLETLTFLPLPYYCEESPWVEITLLYIVSLINPTTVEFVCS